MKVIVTGGTGNTGGALLRQCIADDRITKVFALTRKALPGEVVSCPKVKVVMHDDFSTYPDEIMRQLEGAEACLWAIGGRVDQFNNDEALARRVGADYTLAAARAMLEHFAKPLAAQGSGKKFCFVYCSGYLAEWDQKKRLWFMSETRKIKGSAESGLCEIADQNRDAWLTKIARPAGILPRGASSLTKAASPGAFSISADDLARAMIWLLLEGDEEKRITEHAGLRQAAAASVAREKAELKKGDGS